MSVRTTSLRASTILGLFATGAGVWVARANGHSDAPVEIARASTSGAAAAGSTPTAIAPFPRRASPPNQPDAGSSAGAALAASSPAHGKSTFSMSAEKPQADAGDPDADVSSKATREERLATARRELELLEAQDAKNFLALFDMMKEQNRWDAAKLTALKEESHGYIVERTRVLTQMLLRFIDDPDCDHALEMDSLRILDRNFKEKVDWLARDIPDVGNVQEILTTTTLRVPTFADTTPEPQ
jgi:hypothetical protein